MLWWKQGLLAVLMTAAAVILWLRQDPTATDKVVAIGVPPNFVALIAGEQPKKNADGSAGSRNFRGAENLVITAGVGRAAINDRVSAIGDGEAVRSVTVVPSASGIIQMLHIVPGQSVKAGDILAELESDAEVIARDRAALEVQIAKDALERTERLAGSDAASPVQVTNAKNALEGARLVLRDAQFKLDKRSIVAPIAGRIGLVPVEEGDYVTDETEIATVDDRSRILVNFWIPERFATRVAIGEDVEASAAAVPDETFVGEVTAIASRIERDSRTLQVQAELENDKGLLLPGMSFRITLYFEGDSYPAVDPLAIQWSADGPYVWKVIDGKSERTSINIIQRNSDYVLVSGDLAQGDEVVTEGLQSLRSGSSLKIARRSDAPVIRGS